MSETRCWRTPFVVFADTGALYAFLVVGDVHHQEAIQTERTLRERREQLWTLDSVITELWLLLRRDVAIETCDRLVRGLLDRGVQREHLESQDYVRAWEIGRDWFDQTFSLMDRQAFAAMERSRRFRAWSYDRDFAIFRIGPARVRAIDLIR
jgi:predicted nucleic acid-binding protein